MHVDRHCSLRIGLRLIHKTMWHMQNVPDVLDKNNPVLGKRESKLWWWLVLINMASDALTLRSYIDAFWIRSLLFLGAYEKQNWKYREAMWPHRNCAFCIRRYMVYILVWNKFNYNFIGKHVIDLKWLQPPPRISS